MALSPGDAVRVLMTKWPDRPHSAFTGSYLGADEHGDWVGARAGTECRRAGSRYPAAADWVTLLPRRRWWRAGFYDPPVAMTYVDIATPSVWAGASVTCVDLDLDVVRRVGGEVVVDDEDEFAEHREALGYPPDVVDGAQEALRLIRSALIAEEPPFDGWHQRWLTELHERVPA